MLRVRTELTGWPGAPGLNTFYWQEDGGDAAAIAQGAFTGVHDFWDDIAGLFPDNFTAIVDPIVDELETSNGNLIGSHTATGPNVITGGETGNEFLPAQTMCVLSLRTGAVAGTPPKRVNGRSYLGPMHLGTTDTDGHLKATTIGVVANAAITLMGVTPGLLCVWHRPTTPGGSDGDSFPVTDTLVRNVWGHLTSRRH